MPSNEKKRQRVEDAEDPIDKYRECYQEILKTFIDLLKTLIK